jgi:hypothetical protein
MIKTIAKTQALLSLIASLVLWLLINQNTAVSCLATATMLLLNLFGLYILWKVVFFKKSIALGLLIIIFKYPLIALILWQMSKQDWVQPIGVFVAMLLFLLSIVGVVIYTQRRDHAF